MTPPKTKVLMMPVSMSLTSVWWIIWCQASAWLMPSRKEATRYAAPMPSEMDSTVSNGMARNMARNRGTTR